MNLLEALRALGRRWYIVLPGTVLAVAAALGMLHVVHPVYERKASELLLPGPAYVPTGQNPYLYLSGLGQAADVVVSAASSDNIVSQLAKTYPGTHVTVTRDPLNSGPALVIDVTANSDRNAAGALSEMVGDVSSTLKSIQTRESVPAKDRISVTEITADGHSTVQTKKQYEAAWGAGIGAIVITIIVAAFVDGQARRRRRRNTPSVRRSATQQFVPEEFAAEWSDSLVLLEDDAASHPASSAVGSELIGSSGKRRQ